MELGIDYAFRDDLWDKKKEGSTVPIELLLDPFKGVVYNYTRVAFREENNTPIMSFDYEIIKSPELSMVTLRKNQKFNTTLGLILNALILEAVDENRGDDTKELDSEGGLREESSSILKK